MTDEGMNGPTMADVLAAGQRIAGRVHRTPVATCGALDRMCGAQLFFKCENLQKVGAFKIRGATNAVFSLGQAEASRGVATHSSGNHAAALALAASWRGVPAQVVMPENAPAVKKAAVAGYGATITFCASTLKDREKTLSEVVSRTGATVIHPYNDDRVIAGAGTAALELIEEVPDLDAVLVPVGGGGLLSGTAVAVTALSPLTRIIGAEPAGADDAFRSLAAGRILPSIHPQTMADGLLTSLGDRTFPLIRRLVERIVLVEEADIARAMRLVFERMKLVVEPSAAVPLAALLDGRARAFGARVGLILSGGNVDLARLPWAAESATGRA